MDWIEHDGTCCPVAVGVLCTTRHADGEEVEQPVLLNEVFAFAGNVASNWFWAINGGENHPNRIIAYRLPRSRAADELIERIRNLEPEREQA